MRKTNEYDVFNISHEMALEIYKLTRNFPEEEIYELVSQLRKSAYSIPTRLVESDGEKGKKEFAHFISIALGSCEEVRYQLLLSRNLGYINKKDYERIENEYERIEKMLSELFSQATESS